MEDLIRFLAATPEAEEALKELIAQYEEENNCVVKIVPLQIED